MAGNLSDGPQWPPRSPHEALLSTPGGREKLRRMMNRTSPSPSPSKRTTGTAQTQAAAMLFEDGDDDDEDDEETLQLKLKAIQAQLKLKKLQKEKARKDADNESTTNRAESTSVSSTSIMTTRPAASLTERRNTSSHQAEVQVPASPVRRTQQSMQDPTSPSRIRLGIDKGLTARDISLKRAPSLRQTARAEHDSRTTQRTRGSTDQSSRSGESQKQVTTFGQRMQAARSDEASRSDRQARIRQVRSTAFGLGKTELEDLKRNATEIPDVPDEPIQFTREDVLSRGPEQKRNAANTASAATRTALDMPAIEPYSGFHLSKRIIPHTTMARTLSGKEIYNIEDVLKHVKAPDFELPDIDKDIVIFGILASKSDPKAHKTKSALKEKAGKDDNAAKYMVLKLVDLQWELDLFLFNTGFDRYWKLSPGTVIAILNPTIMPPPPGRTDTGRFSLVINSGEDTILEVGTARDLGFCKSVKKDGKICDSWVNKKRTEFCEFHMNSALEKHLKARQDINAFNTGPGPRNGNASSSTRRGNSARGKDGGGEDKRARGAFDRDTQSHWFLHKKDSAAAMLDNEVLSGHISGTIERGEALKRRLATQEKERDIMKQLGKVGAGAGKEYMRLAQQKREIPTSGADLVHDPDSTSGSTGAEGEPRRMDARSLGLLKDKDHKIHLSPVKRKRTESALSGSFDSSSSTSHSSAFPSRPPSVVSNTKTQALGWGGGLKSKLSRMKDGENLRKGNASSTPQESDMSGTMNSVSSDHAPSRKKTRFVTEKGIRIAGRESLGGELASCSSDKPGDGASTATGPRMVMLDDDDDDDLLILDE
ncbi:uncharacterized protein B0I36DRAFT_296537 [Microdochium trichocladiopsis]|uniref:Zinc finger Mcm10/DnaG-type domain-containing protein n=1 Tax=Microdochium trichocladiopsis TaxID=1682393 RepID=A0A9P8XYU7_9PEZI|nr:uncharacterized protein B0I36DRAFT_296537 [Microdochium trichocladiopsis]KAH7021039.1 hypothetical protein B0I36DRAFT_296537 [Microdochium trichocladiopsis]